MVRSFQPECKASSISHTAWRSSKTHLLKRDALVDVSWSHSCLTILWYLPGPSCKRLLWDSLTWLLRDTLVGHTLVWHFSQKPRLVRHTFYKLRSRLPPKEIGRLRDDNVAPSMTMLWHRWQCCDVDSPYGVGCTKPYHTWVKIHVKPDSAGAKQHCVRVYVQSGPKASVSKKIPKVTRQGSKTSKSRVMRQVSKKMPSNLIAMASNLLAM